MCSGCALCALFQVVDGLGLFKQLDKSQQQALERCARERFALVQGGPGKPSLATPTPPRPLPHSVRAHLRISYVIHMCYIGTGKSFLCAQLLRVLARVCGSVLFVSDCSFSVDRVLASVRSSTLNPPAAADKKDKKDAKVETEGSENWETERELLVRLGRPNHQTLVTHEGY